MRFPCVSLIRASLLFSIVLLRATAIGAAEFDGIIEPHRIVKVGSGVPGIIETVDVDRGDFVKKGQVVATLQSSVEKATMMVAKAWMEQEATIKAKEARMEFSRRKKGREEQLFNKAVLPYSQIDETETSRILAEMEFPETLENKRLAELEYNVAQRWSIE